MNIAKFKELPWKATTGQPDGKEAQHSVSMKKNLLHGQNYLG